VHQELEFPRVLVRHHLAAFVKVTVPHNRVDPRLPVVVRLLGGGLRGSLFLRGFSSRPRGFVPGGVGLGLPLPLLVGLLLMRRGGGM
jgi:hypothetical protein